MPRQDYGRGSASYAANLIVHPTNARLAEDVDLVVKHKSPLVIASVGNPARVVDAIRGYGGSGFLRRCLVKHARRAAEAGVDGLILLCGGSGATPAGSTRSRWSPPSVFFAGPLVLAGAISNGRVIDVAEELGADFAYVGTPFIAATREHSRRRLPADAD
jgi:nitronate monooxygenase